MAFYDLENFSNQPVVCQSSESFFSYSDLLNLSQKFENQLQPRDLVFVMCKNTVGSLLGYLACLRKKSVAVLLDEKVNLLFLQNLIDEYQPSHLLFSTKNSQLKDFGEPLVSVEGFQLNLLNRQSGLGKIHSELALLLTTSGSTGSPKMVRISYENLQENAKSICNYLNLSSQDRTVTTLPMSYSYGLSMINSHLLSGASILMTECSIVERSFWDLLKNCHVTNFGGVPFTYKLLARLKFDKMELPSLSHITQAGGALEPSITEKFIDVCESKNIRFYTMYGQTEATARISYLPPESARENIGSIGRPIPGGEMWLESKENQIIEAPEAEGELIYRGKNVCMGYSYCRADLCLGNDNQGVLRTGDLAKRSSTGYYYILGRKSRIAKVFGNRINLDEVQTLLEKQGLECAVLSGDDALLVFLVGYNKLDEVKLELSKAMSLHSSAILVHKVTFIPRGSSGKIQYSDLMKMVENG